MNSNHERQTVILFGKDPAEVAIPRVTMHEVGVDVHGIEIRATPHRAERRTQRLWAGEITRIQFEPDDLEIAFLEMLVAKATYFDGDRFCQLARQIANMHARAAIDIRRILVSQKQDLHRVYVVGPAFVSSAESMEQALSSACLYTYLARTNSTGISTA